MVRGNWDKSEEDRAWNNATCRRRREAFPEKYILYEARKRATEKNLTFNLTQEDIKIPEVCPVFNIPLYVGKGKRTWNSPTLDRFNNSKGYTKDNVQVISWRANHLKNDGTLDEMRSLVQWMEKNGT